jgi:hypothetical protein
MEEGEHWPNRTTARSHRSSIAAAVLVHSGCNMNFPSSRHPCASSCSPCGAPSALPCLPCFSSSSSTRRRLAMRSYCCSRSQELPGLEQLQGGDVLSANCPTWHLSVFMKMKTYLNMYSISTLSVKPDRLSSLIGKLENDACQFPKNSMQAEWSDLVSLNGSTFGSLSESEVLLTAHGTTQHAHGTCLIAQNLAFSQDHQHHCCRYNFLFCTCLKSCHRSNTEAQICSLKQGEELKIRG